jgi:hypothetical protein
VLAPRFMYIWPLVRPAVSHRHRHGICGKGVAGVDSRRVLAIKEKKNHRDGRPAGLHLVHLNRLPALTRVHEDT